MANLTQAFENLQKGCDPVDVIAFPMAAVKAYRGGAIGIVKGTGYAQAIDATSNPANRFLGVSLSTKDNSAGVAGAKNLEVARKGCFKFNSSGITIADVGKKVYFTDDNTVSKTPGNIYAGRIEAFIDGEAWIRIDEATMQGVRLRVVTMQPAPLGAAGTSRQTGYVVPTGGIAFAIASSRGYSVKPNFATSAVLLLQKVSATVRTTLLSTANVDVNNTAPAVDTPTANTMSATPAALKMVAGDQLEASITAVGALTAAGDTWCSVEVLEIGGDND